MGFDWRAFATGFFEKTQEIQETRQEEAKQFEEDQRAAAERNAQDISRRRAIANTAVSYSRYLQDQGLTNAQIQAAIAAGPDKLAELTSAVQTAVRANGGRPLGASDIDAIMSVPEGFMALDMDIEEIVNRSFGLVAPERTEQPQQEFSLMDRIGGRHLMSRAEQRINAAPYQDGLTIGQINELAQQSDYESLIPGTFVTITEPSIYDPTTDGVEFVRTTRSVMDAVESSRAYRAANTEQRDAMLEDAVQSVTEGFASRFGNRFLQDQEVYLQSILGEEGAANLITSFTNPPDEEQPQDGATQQTPSETTEVPGLGPYGETIEVSTLPPLPEAGAEQQEPAPAEAPEGVVTVTGTDGVEYTYEDWQGMTRTQRQAAGLPTSRIRAAYEFSEMFGGGLGAPSEGSRGRNASRTERREGMTTMGGDTNAEGTAGRRDRRISANAERQLVEQYGRSEDDIELISTSGQNMQEFAMQRGVTTLAQMEDAIRAYAADRGINPPQDVNFVAQVLFANLVDSGIIAQQPQQ